MSLRKVHGTGLRAFGVARREILLYLVFGGLTTAVGVCSYAAFNLWLGINALIANVLSWILAVLFAFFTNRVWVFAARTETVSEFGRQLVRFFGGRIATLLAEEAILAVFVTWLEFDSIAVKLAAQAAVMILNYVISKWIVFRGKT